MDVRDQSSGDPPTGDERRNLTIEGFDLDEDYPEYGNSAVVQAYRAGFHDGASVVV